MNVELFKTYYGNFFIETEREKQLRQIGLEYHIKTELYDQSVCTGKTENGIAVPINNFEFQSINKNAIKVIIELIRLSGFSKTRDY